MFGISTWFAWYPVKARGRSGKLHWVWLVSVYRDQLVTPHGAGPVRYYLI